MELLQLIGTVGPAGQEVWRIHKRSGPVLCLCPPDIEETGITRLSWGDLSQESSTLAYLMALHVCRVPREAVLLSPIVLVGTVVKLAPGGWVLSSEQLYRAVSNAVCTLSRMSQIAPDADVWDGTLAEVEPCTFTL